jgi:hypothetical protein
VRLEALGKLKKKMTSTGIEPATFRLVMPQPITIQRGEKTVDILTVTEMKEAPE